MTEQTQIRKKKRKQLLIRLNNPQENEIHRDINEIIKKIFEIFRYHIGKANAINSYDLFKEIFSVEPEEVDLFQRSYLWNIIKMLLAKMRTNGELFTVNNGLNYYVLQTHEEAKKFKTKCNALIKAFKGMKKKADRWVYEEKWRNI
jgi:hypothetical protein